ncbi:tetratricopeptide repeat protein [Methanosarcina sp. Mfa9]|uniref:tetratricopeptide repeat protein n=1 Tax=Methanosarcina sp. Mfa9 TaxID=3439063 RepID=UPI003F86B7F2
MINLDRSLIDAWYYKGLALSKLNLYEDAISSFDTAIKLCEFTECKYDVRELILDECFKYERSRSVFESSVKKYSIPVDLKIKKGFTYRNMQKYEDAICSLEEVLKIYPSCEEAWKIKGNIFYDLNNYGEALAAYNTALKINPGNIYLWNNKGVALSNLRRYNDSLKAYNKAIDICPKYANVWYNKGLTLSEYGKFNDALEAYREASSLKEEDYAAYTNSGEILFNLKDINGALEQVTKVLEVKNKVNKTTKAFAFKLMGQIQIEQQNYLKAIDNFDHASNLDRENPLFLLLKAHAQYLRAEFCYKHYEKMYNQEMLSIIRGLEKANMCFSIKCQETYGEKIKFFVGGIFARIYRLYPWRNLRYYIKMIRRSQEMNEYEEKKKYKKIQAYILYFLGGFYYKCDDVFTAMEKLEKCVELKPCTEIQNSANELIDYIWNYQIRPIWWKWWLYSPVKTWSKRVLFLVLFSLILVLVIYPFIDPGIFKNIDSTLYVFFVLIPILLLVSPCIRFITGKGLELKMNLEPSVKFEFSHAIVEIKLLELEKDFDLKE